MGLGQFTSVATGGRVRTMLRCPYQAEDLTIQDLRILGLAVSTGRSKSITEAVDPRGSVVEVAMKEDPLPWTEG